MLMIGSMISMREFCFRIQTSDLLIYRKNVKTKHLVKTIKQNQKTIKKNKKIKINAPSQDFTKSLKMDHDTNNSQKTTG